MTPDDRKYVDTHEWIKTDGALAIVGISDHAQEQLGDITYVELPEVGTQVNAGDMVAVVESVKAAGDIYAPVAGTIVEVNETLEDTPEIVNQSPYEDGWLFKLEGTDPAAIDGLLNAAGYENSLESEQ